MNREEQRDEEAGVTMLLKGGNFGLHRKSILSKSEKAKLTFV